MDQTMMWLMLCVGSAVAGVVIGLLLTKRVREAAWRKGYSAGIKVVVSAIRRGMPRVQDERMGWAYCIPDEGVERIMRCVVAPEVAESEWEKTEN